MQLAPDKFASIKYEDTDNNGFFEKSQVQFIWQTVQQTLKISEKPDLVRIGIIFTRSL